MAAVQIYFGACKSLVPQAEALASPGIVKNSNCHVKSSEFLGCRFFSQEPAGRGSSAKTRSFGMKIVAAADSSAIPALNDLPLINYFNAQGRIVPVVEPTTEASVFAIFDNKKKLQYVGFSKDVRNTLRTLMGRRPELCYYYKLVNFRTLDQEKMLEVRKQWIGEVGLPPVGNSDPVQRNLWEKPAESGSISERGKAAAATSKAKTLLQILQDRGLKEEMVYDPVLLEQGLCDVLPAADDDSSGPEVLAAGEVSKVSKVSVTSPRGDVIEFEIEFQGSYKTNGGMMFDVIVNKDEKDTIHRVICGKIYYEAAGISAEEFVERVFAFLFDKKIPRHTEGVLTGDMFPINYFAVSEVAQTFTDMKDWFTEELPESYWRFNRIHSYGDENSPVLSESKLFSPKY